MKIRNKNCLGENVFPITRMVFFFFFFFRFETKRPIQTNLISLIITNRRGSEFEGIEGDYISRVFFTKKTSPLLARSFDGEQLAGSSMK